MQLDPAGIRLIGIARDFPALAQAREQLIQFGFIARGARPALGSFDCARRCRVTELGEQRREEPIARRVADADILGGCSKAFGNSSGLARGNPDGMRGRGSVETDELGACGRRAEHPAGCGDVPAARVMMGRYGIAEPALDLDPEHECMEDLGSR